MTNALLEQLRPSYANLWGKMIAHPEVLPEVKAQVAKILAGKLNYMGVETSTGIPWRFIGIIHSMECDCSFKEHLHNGDPLTARTVDEPKGRPLTGEPPFTWHDSAVDALQCEGFKASDDWSIEGMLFHWEGYNGWGYRKNHGINSPYLWSGSNEYTKGKYGSDGKYNPELVSKQIGAALLLKELL